MPSKATRFTKEKIEPVTLRDGYLHLHYVQARMHKIIDTEDSGRKVYEERYEWAVRNRHMPGMCGTTRCVYLKIDVEGGLREGVCEHEYGMPDRPALKCKHCGEYREIDLRRLKIE